MQFYCQILICLFFQFDRSVYRFSYQGACMHNCDQAVCIDNLTEELSINNLTKEYA